ncbi:dihydrodipicolinate synthase family protein [Bradyrhizobium sp. dw_411]|uniref:dihydrodipicolinate synthase family protein n=1 Tax=Bradyrhizobium sp. dw_411 TaxID=2720082 RepID=UPI001BCBDAE6|nr:dihydrodipicolinate synthase family protein [Bradyrhizobium sp. dw_411]
MTRLISADDKGVYIIAATPFEDDGTVDLNSIDRLVDFYLDCGVTGMTILGMMGEASKLSEEESRAVTKRFLGRVGGKVPVIVGVSNPGTDSLLRFAMDSMEAGAAGVMVAPISTLRTEDQTFRYFAGICEGLGSSVPMALQDFPLATLVHISVDTINKLIDACPQLVMLKHEDCPGFNKLSSLRRGSLEGKHRRISILVGNGGLYLPQELARGADGAMTGFGYPEMLVEVIRRFALGDPTGGEDVFDIYLPLLRYEAQPGIGLALRKRILYRRGVIKSDFVRSPGPKLSRDDLNELEKLIQRLERRLADNPLRLEKIA